MKIRISRYEAKFRFAELYKNNRTAVEKTLAAMWCGEARNESQKGYINQLKMIIPKVFAPKDAMPLVQCMNSYETVYPEHEAEANEWWVHSGRNVCLMQILTIHLMSTNISAGRLC